MKKPLLLYLVASLTLLLIAGCKQQTGNAIKIGEFASLTGKEATFGTMSHNGTLLAIEEANAAGGALGKKFVLLTEDDQSKQGEPSSVVKKLISSDGVVAILGEVASSRSMEAAPICQQNKIPMISPSSTNVRLTEIGEYIFRVCFTDEFQGKLLATFARKSLKAAKVAILTDTKSDYSVGLTRDFKAPVVEGGGKVVGEQVYNGGDKDFKG